jgi:putative thioredoxin
MPNNFDFQRDVVAASTEVPIVVDFWAEWCAPCRVLGPVLEKLASQANSAWKLVKLNTEEYPQLAMEYGIRSIPAVKMFHNGQVIAEFIGALPETQVQRWLDEHLPTLSKELIEKARAALANGDKAHARELLEAALKDDKNNFDARIELAKLIFESEAEKAEKLVKETPPEHPLYKQAEVILTLTRLITQYETLAQSAKNAPAPAAAWNAYLTGVQALRQQEYERALTSWIEALTMHRDIDDDGPRRACVALFTWLGTEHELTRKYHRAFTSALF